MGHNGDFGHGLCVLFQGRHQSVAHFVVRNQPLFHIGQHGVLLLGTGNYRFKGDHQVLLVHCLTAVTHCTQSRFIHQVGKVRTHRTGSGLGNFPQVHILAEADFPGMHLQGVQTALEVGTVHNDPPVKPTGTEQGLVQDLRPVGGRQTHNALGGLKAVDLAEQLVQGLLLLGVAAEPVIPGAADRVDFVNKDNTGSHLCRLLEQVPHPAGAHAHKHLHEIRTGDGEEGHIRLTGHRLGKQGLAGTGRAHQQRTLGKLGTDGGILLGVVEKINDLLQRLLCLVLARHILEGDAGLLFHVDLGLTLAEAPHHAVAAHALGQQIHNKEESADHDDIGQDHHDEGIVLHDFLVDRNTLGCQFFTHRRPVTAVRQAGITGFLLGGRFGRLLLGHIHHPVCLEFHFRQLARRLGFQKIRIGGLGVLAAFHHVHHPAEDQHQGQRNHQRSEIVISRLVAVRLLGFVGVVSAIGIHFPSPPFLL